MKALFVSILAAAAFASLPLAADRKPLPNQAGNDDIEISGNLIFNPIEIQQVLGADPGPNILVVRLKAGPKNEQTLRIGPDDFLLIYRKDGQRSEAMLPGQIAGKGALVVKAAPDDNGLAGQGNGHGWLGVGGMSMPTGRGGSKDDKGKSRKRASSPDAKDDENADGKAPAENQEDPIVATLQSKMLPDRETKEPLEGLLYFTIDGKKFKAKDFSLIYNGPAGKLVMDFQ